MNTLLLGLIIISGSFNSISLDSESLSRFVVASSGFMSWNNEKNYGALIVMVLNDGELETALKSKSNLRTANGRRIDVRTFSWDRLSDANIVYVGSADKTTKAKLSKFAFEHKIVVMSSYSLPGVAAMRIFQAENKIRFELDEKGFENSGISVNPTLKRLSVSK